MNFLRCHSSSSLYCGKDSIHTIRASVYLYFAMLLANVSMHSSDSAIQNLRRHHRIVTDALCSLKLHITLTVGTQWRRYDVNASAFLRFIRADNTK